MVRSWAPRGHTPILSQRGRNYQNLSAMAAVTLSPRRHRCGLYFSLFPAQAICQDHVVWFLRQMSRHLRGPKVLLWDRLPVHRGADVQNSVAGCRNLHLEWLPPYAPELNAVEYLWSWLKTNPLANDSPPTLDDLTHSVTTAVQPLPQRQRLLQGFIKATRLPIRFRLP